jgi:ribonuclease P protein component
MPRSARKQGYSRRHRFTARGSFGAVLGGSRKERSRAVVLHVLPAASGGPSRLGIALTRRLVPSSVERNRVKRIVREIFRMHPVKQAGLDCVVALRAKLDEAGTREMGRQVAHLFDRLAAGEGE